MKKLAGSALIAALFTLGCDPPQDADADADAEFRLYANLDYLWPGNPVWIEVCWENPGAATAERRGWVQDAIESNWERYARVNFVEWDTCSTGDDGIHVRIADVRSSAGQGVNLDGVDDGVTLNLSFATWGPAWCSASNANREQCVRATALHEFGHVLGFYHEEERPDYDEPPGTPAGSACDEQSFPNGSPQYYGAYDIDSVMSYCGQPFDDPATWKTVLSAGDIAAVQHAYGRRQAGSMVSVRGDCMASHAAAPNGDDVFMWDCDEAHDDQEWIRNGPRLMLAPNRCLETVGWSSGSDGRLWDCDGYSLQSWTFERVEIRGWGALCMDLQGGSTTPWTNIQMWECGALGGANQKWTITPQGQIKFGGPESDSCVTAYNSNVFIHNCDYPYYQEFDFLPGGEVRPRHLGSICLDVQAWTTAEYLGGDGLPGNGQNLQTFPCWSGQLNQKWNLSGQIHQAATGLCLDREFNGTANGTRAQAYTCNSTSAQTWDYYFK